MPYTNMQAYSIWATEKSKEKEREREREREKEEEGEMQTTA